MTLLSMKGHAHGLIATCYILMDKTSWTYCTFWHHINVQSDSYINRLSVLMFVFYKKHGEKWSEKQWQNKLIKK